METTTLVLGAVAIIVTQIGTIVVLMLQRQWDVQDRKDLAIKVVTTGDALTQHVTELATKVEEGTATSKEAAAASKEAAQVANHSNEKLNKQQEALEELNKRLLAKEEKPT